MLYDKIIQLCRPYLGLATEAFLHRQIFTHMKLNNPEELTEQHLDLLAQWCFHSGRKIMDKTQAKKMADEILKLEERNFIRNLFRPN